VPQNKKTILLVEDEVLIALGETTELEKAGYAVIRCSTGEKAVDIVGRDPSAVDLILMDIDLGNGIDGTEAARRILGHNDIPILFLSSHIEPEIVLKTEEITNYGYVVKSSSITVLDASIKMAFRLFSALRQLDLSNSELKKALERLDLSSGELKVSEEKLSGAFQACPDWMSICRLPEGAFIDVNGGFTSITGYQRDEIIGRTAPAPDRPLWVDAERHRFLIRSLLDRGHLEDFETEILAKDGSVKSILGSSRMFEIGGVRHSVSIFKDITERNAAEAARRAIEERFRLAMEATTDGIWDRDIQAGSVYYSPAYYRMLDHEESEFPSNSQVWLDYIHPDDRPMVLKANSDCVENLCDSFSVEFRMRTKDGTWKWLRSRGKAVSRDASGRARRMIGTHTDITAQIEAERARGAASERFRAIVENTPDHIIMQDRDLRYTMVVNPQLGLTEAGMLGKTDQEILPSQEAEALTEVKRRVLKSGEQAHLELPVTNIRGELEYFDGSYIPRFDASGRADGLIGYFRNVTKEHASGVRIDKLVAEKELLVREMRHRVLNNLATLAGYLSLQITGHESEEAGSILKSAISQTKGMQLLFDKLYRPGQREGVSLRSFLPDLVDEILGTFGRRSDVAVTVDIDDVAIDSNRLSALGIMVNELITNSIKHASKGTARLAISLTATREGERIRLVYGDNGPGLPPGVSGSESPGFGLTLIEGLADQIDGTLRVESGDGARFIVEFDL
jgi:PAS domain S-box-containing protein